MTRDKSNAGSSENIVRYFALLVTFIILVFSFSACSITRMGINTVIDTDTVSSPLISVPLSSEDYRGMHYLSVQKGLSTAGFTNIQLHPLSETSDEQTGDDAVISVSIDGITDFSEGMEFASDVLVEICYHPIPTIMAPASSDSYRNSFYMDAGQELFDAGFSNVITDEIYDIEDISTTDKHYTTVTANGRTFSKGEALPIGAEIQVIGHFSRHTYSLTINIDFEKNLLFSKYGVRVLLNDEELATLEHGQDESFKKSLYPGNYELRFENAEDSSVNNSIRITVTADIEATYHIECKKDGIETKQTAFADSFQEGMIMMPFSSNKYLRKNVDDACNAMKALGFNSVSKEPSTESIWNASQVDTVVRVQIGQNENFAYSDIVNKSDPVIIYYHIPDYQFEEEELLITEKDTFTLAYTIGDERNIGDILFAVEDPRIIQINENGSFTALKPGQTNIIAKYKDDICDICSVWVDNLVIPIDRLHLESNHIEAAAGAHFDIVYTYEPAEANHVELISEISNDCVKLLDDGSYYANRPGTAVISLKQDERVLAECIVNVVVIDIETLLFSEAEAVTYVDHSIDIPFSIVPVQATLWGMKIEVKDSQVLEAAFDETGKSIIHIKGLKIGDTEVVITDSKGNEYRKAIQVLEIIPSELSIDVPKKAKSFRIGDTISLASRMKPDDVSDKSVMWTTSDKAIVTVDDSGQITAVGVGTVEITATHKCGLASTVQIVVQPTPVNSVALSSDWDNSQHFIKGKIMHLNAVINPENATDKSLVWSSSDESIAVVDQKGEVVAKGAGQVTITAEASNGRKGIMQIEVTPTPQNFKVTWSANMKTNDHVGSNWGVSLEINSENLYSGSTVSLMPGEEFTINLAIVEEDSNPDKNSYYGKMLLTNEICQEGFMASGDLCVKENAGRYSGNIADWSFEIKLIPIN